MRIAIVTEKPHMARVISKAAQPLFPNDTLDYLICWPVGIYTPALPRGLHWRDYPYIAPFEVDGFERRKAIGDSPANQETTVSSSMSAAGMLSTPAWRTLIVSFP